MQVVAEEVAALLPPPPQPQPQPAVALANGGLPAAPRPKLAHQRKPARASAPLPHTQPRDMLDPQPTGDGHMDFLDMLAAAAAAAPAKEPAGLAGGGGGEVAGLARLKEEDPSHARHGQPDRSPAVQEEPPVALEARDAAASGGSGCQLASAGSGGGDAAAPPALTDLAARVAQRKVQQALEAFAAADTQSAESMLRPLKLLAIGGKGGEVLRVSRPRRSLGSG